jgi:hypothetical protein
MDRPEAEEALTSSGSRSAGLTLDAVRRGYAYVLMNERGHFFSEGNYDILGQPRTDGYDAIFLGTGAGLPMFLNQLWLPASVKNPCHSWGEEYSIWLPSHPE